ncbi:MAG: acyltransferase family protein [Acidobacteriaceae bacterium]|nr:acyltransferase family protein [Acidobacteriaceae bacterium]MBV9779210.1 acyltransferase family protein [Acidobacteriaceae bacterium]
MADGYPTRTQEVLITGQAVRARLAYVDNLRWTMILLVISMHAADTYSPLGNWYFTDRRPITPATLLFFAAWQMYLQSFFMGLLFFVAGYFVPSSFDRKGFARFVRDRAFRLGLPVLFYMFILGPVTEYFFSHSWNSTEPTSFANEWIKHIRNGQFMQENGPLWFCLALLIFSVVYAVTRSPSRFRARLSNKQEEKSPPGSLKLIAFAFGMAAFEFLIRLMLPGVTFLNMHLGDFSQYILLFSAGILAARGEWLPKLSFATGMKWLVIVLPLGFAAWFTMLSKGGALTGHASAFFGGWHWQSAALDLWESFTCVAMSLGLLALFREHFNSQGRLGKFLSDNAFGVYVFHPPIVIAGARLLHGFSWNPLLKFGLLTGFGIIVSFVLTAAVFRRTPLLRQIL